MLILNRATIPFFFSQIDAISLGPSAERTHILSNEHCLGVDQAPNAVNPETIAPG